MPWFLKQLALRGPAIRLIAALLVVGGGWFALTRDDSTGAAVATRYVEGVAGQPSRVHPLYASTNPTDADIAMLVFNGLMRTGPDGLPSPDLAERWDVTPDGLRYTFVLRSGLHWHDGRPLTSEDVAFTIGALQSEEFDGPQYLALEWRDIAIETPDERTVVFTLPAPVAGFLNRATIGIVPRHLLEGVARGSRRFAEFLARPIGSGPFRVVSLDEGAALLERNTSYHLGVPAIDALELRFHNAEAALSNALSADELDGALLSQYAHESVHEVLARRSDLAATTYTLAEYDVLYMNVRDEPLSDPTVRRAIAAAVQPATLLGAAGVPGLPGGSPFVPGSWAHTPRQTVATDPNALLEDAGWPRAEDGRRRREGQTLSLELATNADPIRTALSSEIARRLRGVGIEVSVTTLPAAQLIAERLRPGAFDLALFGWDAGDDPDPYGGWHSSQVSPDGANVSGFQDPRADESLALARLTLDVPERRGLYARFADVFAESAPAAVVRYPTATYLRPDALEVPPPGLLFTNAHRFSNVHLWRFTH